MEVVVTTGAISCAKLQSNHHHQQTEHPTFYRPDALLVTQPTVSEHWRENMAIHRLAFGLPTLPLTTNSSWFPWGTVAMPLISPRMPVPQQCQLGLIRANYLQPTPSSIPTHLTHLVFTRWDTASFVCIVAGQWMRSLVLYRSVLYAIPAHC